MSSDEELVRRAKAGESAAYAELVRQWSAPVLALCRSQVRSRDACDDLCQEALLRGWKSLGTLQDVNKFGAWLRGIARRVCLDWLKSRQNRQVPFSVLGDTAENGSKFADGHPSPAEELVRNSEAQRLMNQIDELPDDEREVLLLYSTGDWTYHQLAEFLEIAVATVNIRLARARERLRKRMTVHERTD